MADGPVAVGGDRAGMASNLRVRGSSGGSGRRRRRGRDGRRRLRRGARCRGGRGGDGGGPGCGCGWSCCRRRPSWSWPAPRRPGATLGGRGRRRDDLARLLADVAGGVVGALAGLRADRGGERGKRGGCEEGLREAALHDVSLAVRGGVRGVVAMSTRSALTGPDDKRTF